MATIVNVPGSEEPGVEAISGFLGSFLQARQKKQKEDSLNEFANAVRNAGSRDAALQVPIPAGAFEDLDDVTNYHKFINETYPTIKTKADKVQKVYNIKTGQEVSRPAKGGIFTSEDELQKEGFTTVSPLRKPTQWYTEAGKPLGKPSATRPSEKAVTLDEFKAQRGSGPTETGAAIEDLLASEGLENNAKNRVQARQYIKKGNEIRNIVKGLYSTQFGEGFVIGKDVESQKEYLGILSNVRTKMLKQGLPMEDAANAAFTEAVAKRPKEDILGQVPDKPLTGIEQVMKMLSGLGQQAQPGITGASPTGPAGTEQAPPPAPVDPKQREIDKIYLTADGRQVRWNGTNFELIEIAGAGG